MDTRIAVISTIGLAFWWPMLRNSVTGFLFGAPASDALETNGPLPLFLIVASVLSLVACLPISRPGGGAGRRTATETAAGNAAWHGNSPRHARFVWTIAAICGLSSVANAAVTILDGPVQEWARIAGPILMALCYVALPLAWASMLRGAGLSAKHLFIIEAGSYALSFVVGFLSYLDAPWNLIRPIGAPAISGAMLLCCCRRAALRPDMIDRLEESVRDRGPDAPSPHNGMRFWAPYCLTLVFFLVASVATGFINTGSVSYVPSSSTLIRDCASLVLTCALIGIVCTARTGEKARFALVAVLGVILFTGTFAATFLGPDLLAYGTALMQASKSCFSLVLFDYVVTRADASEPGAARRTIAGLFVAPTLASTAISYLAVPVAAAAFNVPYGGFWGTLSLGMGFLLGVFVFVFFSLFAIRGLEQGGGGTEGRGSLEGPHAARPDASACIETSVELLGAAHGLTDREREVLALLAAGNTYRRIAERLGVSDNTVQYHIKNMYRKLDVHTRQELIDLVSACGGQAR